MGIMDWLAHTYYGRNENRSSKTQVHYHMIDEFLKEVFEKAELKFQARLKKITTEFQDDILQSVTEIKKSVKDNTKKINQCVTDMTEWNRENKLLQERVIKFLSEQAIEKNNVY